MYVTVDLPFMLYYTDNAAPGSDFWDSVEQNLQNRYCRKVWKDRSENMYLELHWQLCKYYGFSTAGRIFNTTRR